MSIVLMYGAGVPVVKLGRMAGQFAKPRSEDTETINGVTLPSYRGDNINSSEFTEEARRPDPRRLLKAYDQSCSTLNLLRAFSNGGYASMQRVSKWNLDFMEDTERGRSTASSRRGWTPPSTPWRRAASTRRPTPAMNTTEFYTAHEALHLGYEEKLTRLDSTTEEYYGCSATFVVRRAHAPTGGGAHGVFRGISNPIGIKISDKVGRRVGRVAGEDAQPGERPRSHHASSPAWARRSCASTSSPHHRIEEAGLNVLWVTDPMHGNTIKTDNGFKTRPFERVRDEIMAFFEVHEQMGTHPGGVHLEMTGQDVTECTGGTAEVTIGDLELRYLTHCDPRLNASQALELAFLMSSKLAARARAAVAALADRGVGGLAREGGDAEESAPEREEKEETNLRRPLREREREREREISGDARRGSPSAAKDAVDGSRVPL